MTGHVVALFLVAPLLLYSTFMLGYTIGRARAREKKTGQEMTGVVVAFSVILILAMMPLCPHELTFVK